MAEATVQEAEASELESRWSAARVARIVALLGLLGGAIVYGVHSLRSIWGTEATDDAFVDGHVVYVSPRVTGQVLEVLVPRCDGRRRRDIGPRERE